MKFRQSRIGGLYFRVVGADWDNPRDASWSAFFGGRWNPRGLPCLYLNCDKETTYANYLQRFNEEVINVEDVATEKIPHVAGIEVSVGMAIDVYTPAGIKSVQLPSTYPYTSTTKTRLCRSLLARG